MSSRAIRRAAERKAVKLAAKAAKVMTASVGSINNEDNIIAPVVEIKPSSERRLISDAQLAANRANARLSHGAVTDAGREASSRNATTHGLTSQHALVAGDDKESYQKLVASHFERHAPANDEERELVQLIADSKWRLLKIAPLEAGIYDVGRVEHAEGMFTSEKDPVRRAGLIDSAITMLYDKHLKNLHLQERRIRNQHTADLAKLKELQTERIEKIARDAKQIIDDNRAFADRVYKYIKNAKMAKLPFEPRNFGFDFSMEEWEQYSNASTRYYMVTDERLNFKNFLAGLRAAQSEEKAA